MKRFLQIIILIKIFNLSAQENHIKTGRQIYVIPVVFHILHFNGIENISDAQVMDAVDLLTKDFRMQNADTANIINVFMPIAADCEIEFRLANIDPWGNCTNGIEHIYTPRTFLADDSSKINPWPDTKYLNFWVVNSMKNSAAAMSVTLPAGPAGKVGFLMLHDYVGSIGTASPFGTRTLTLSMGYFLNLIHPWGFGPPGISCGDDSIADTPETAGWDHCPQQTQAAICNPPTIENYQNFMEFSYCGCMFTQGQKVRMHAALNSPTYGISTLWSSSNLIATGTDGSPITICSPRADFYPDPLNACTGTSITFIDHSWNAPIISWNWTFPGGNPASSIDSNPTVVYNTAGLYNAQLVVTSAGGIDSVMKVSIVRISDSAMNSMPYTEDFEDTISFPGSDSWIYNRDSLLTWSQVSNANTTAGGAHSIMMNNFNVSSGEVDSWISPSIDFSNVSSPIHINFYVANAARSFSTDDELKLFYSINCGKTWVPLSYSKSGMTLSTAGVITTNFIPANQNQWRLETVTANSVQLQPNVRFKFQNTSDNGNNTFIDDINITGTNIGIDEMEGLQSGFTLYPNPSYGESTIKFELTESAQVKIEVKNVLGQTIYSKLDKTLVEGLHEYKIHEFNPGIYLVDAAVNGRHYVKKLIVY